MKLHNFTPTLAWFIAGSAFAVNGSVTAPWLPLTGQLVESATLPVGDTATGGWPAQLLAALQAAGIRPTCAAPLGASEAEKNQCVPSLIYRVGQDALYVSPDAGLQWYPISTSCSLTVARSAHLLAVDSGRPGHLVTWHDRGTDGSGATQMIRRILPNTPRYHRIDARLGGLAQCRRTSRRTHFLT